MLVAVGKYRLATCKEMQVGKICLLLWKYTNWRLARKYKQVKDCLVTWKLPTDDFMKSKSR